MKRILCAASLGQIGENPGNDISQTFYLPPLSLSTEETLSLPNRSEILPGGWESDGINKYPPLGEKHILTLLKIKIV